MADIRINALATTATTPASDDYLALDGTAQGTRKILATNIANNVTDVILGTSGPSVKSSLSARAPRQGLVFDGSTSGGGTTSIPAFGSSDFTVSAWLNLSDLSTRRAWIGGETNSFASSIVTSGSVWTTKENVIDNTGSTTLLTAGKFFLVTYTRSGGNAGSYYINGVLSNTITDSNNYSVGSTKVGSTTGGAFPFSGQIVGVVAYNRALSASEVVALYEAGAPAGADYNSASNTSLSTSALTAFAPFTLYSTFSSANGTSFSASDASANRACATNASFAVSAGQKILVSFTLTQSGSDFPQVILCDTTSVVDSSNAVISTSGANNITLTATRAGTVRVRFFSFAASNYSVVNLSVTRLGLLLAPDAAQAGGGYVWNDQSGNLAQIVLPSSGVQWNLPSVAGQRIRGTTSTNGNQQLLGASVLLPAECQITHVRARARSGTPTITIGTASGGAQIVASVALSTTWLNCTIALTGGIVSSADDIWVGSNSTDVVETDIAFQPLDF